MQPRPSCRPETTTAERHRGAPGRPSPAEDGSVQCPVLTRSRWEAAISGCREGICQAPFSPSSTQLSLNSCFLLFSLAVPPLCWAPGVSWELPGASSCAQWLLLMLLSPQSPACRPKEVPGPWSHNCTASPALAAAFGTRRNFGLLWGGVGQGGAAASPSTEFDFGSLRQYRREEKDSSCMARELPLGSVLRQGQLRNVLRSRSLEAPGTPGLGLRAGSSRQAPGQQREQPCSHAPTAWAAGRSRLRRAREQTCST